MPKSLPFYPFVVPPSGGIPPSFSTATVPGFNFPNATVAGFPDQNAALLEVSTGRAAAVVVEDYILAQFSDANPNQLVQAELDAPLSLYYGSWGVQKGNSALVSQLDAFLCKVQNDGTLEELYTSIMAPQMPEMAGGC